MVTLIRRILTVVLGLLALGLVFQQVLTRDAALRPQFVLLVTQSDANGHTSRWQFTVGHYWKSDIDGAPVSVEGLLERLASAHGELALKAQEAGGGAWTASRDAGGRFVLDGRPALLEQLGQRVRAACRPPEDFTPTRPVTVMDVLEANIPMPTRSKVSFPQCSYRDAWPEANDSPEIVIERFGEAPMVKWLRDPSRLPEGAGEDDLRNWRQWRARYAEDMPPVEQRLPINPAVTVGPDGLGRYGGVWRRCGMSSWNFIRQICYESFTRHDPSGNLQPCLAYKWEVSPDWRTFTYYLRKGHRWSDGAPFTAHDITWTCNTVIGSWYWSMPPDWMQATDGSLMVYPDDAPSWPALAARIVREADGRQPAPGQQLRSLADEATWGRIEAMARGEANDPSDPDRLADGLNELLRKPGLYDAQAFAGVDLDVERRQMEAIGLSRLDRDQMEMYLLMLERADLLRRLAEGPGDAKAVQPIELNRLNVLLFRAAYRGLIVPPRKQRVKVETVPDESGDDSHIIRFTFRKPNSIFLEQSATFMFYRGLFNLPKHTTRHMHPDGSILLAPSDVWRWEAFWERARQEAERNEATAGRRLWDRLDESVRRKILAGLPPPNGGEADWQYDRRVAPLKWEILEAVNAVLSQRDFYDSTIGGALDTGASREALLDGKGFAEMARDMNSLRQYRELLVLEDLLQRLRRDGPESLNEEEHTKINVAAVRAAYSDRTDNTLLARTRWDGLNREAARDPRRFDTWTRRLFYRTDYHAEGNPHHPFLGAWRLIDENDKPEIMAIRNPYYYRVDAAGNQLPYFDAVRTSVSARNEIRLLKLLSGNVDFQTLYLSFSDFSVLKQGERDKGMYEIRLWAEDCWGGPLFIPLQPHKDPAYRRLQEDANFRHALSLALNRQEIIDVVYGGMGQPAQRAVPYGSQYYSPREASAFVEYDPNRANRLLDAMGLDKRAKDGTRLLWDGRPLILDLNITQDFPLDPARLAVQYWQDIGLNVQIKLRTGGMISRMEEMGLCDIRGSIGGGSFFGPLLPAAYYPSHPAEAVQWHPWCTYLRNGGRSGQPPPDNIRELDRMWTRLVSSADPQQKMSNWKAVTDRFAADLPVIGVTTSPGVVVYVRKGVRNVPRIAMAGWIAHSPGNSCPECFFFESGIPASGEDPNR